jgi:predicted methyltransferase
MKLILATLTALTLAGALPTHAVAQDYNAIVSAPDRSDADRTTDKRRNPVKLLEFTGVKAGMKVLDMEAGAGYTTELLARAVGPNGTVYAQDSADVLARQVKDKFDIRSKNPVMKNVVHVVRNYDDPLPPDVRNLDLITFFFAYHDMTYMPVDRAEMNRKLFAALKPGGYLIIADHSAKRAPGRPWARPFTASRKRCCARKSKRPDSSSSRRATFCAMQRTAARSSSSARRRRSTSSC